MARNVREKIANGQNLDEDDVRYAVDRGIELPEEYGEQVRTYRLEANTFGTPPSGSGIPVMQGGPAFPPQPGAQQSMGPGLFLPEETLGALTGPVLDEIADAVGVDVPRKKADKVAALMGAEVTEASEEGDDQEPEE